MSHQKAFGDFQTPPELASKVVKLVHQLYGAPDRIVEPTAGLGTFLCTSAEKWGTTKQYEGYEVNPDYVQRASNATSHFGVRIICADFFTQDWKKILGTGKGKKTLVIGNPPWITNSGLGLLGSENLPKKSNFQKLRGFDARTGKSNFDIAEWMLIRLIEAITPNDAIAMLCKTMTARKVLKHVWKTDGGRKHSLIFNLDAKNYFDAAVDACLLFVTGERTSDRTATVYSDLNLKSDSKVLGFLDGDLVADVRKYETYRSFDGGVVGYTWRSGIKHDAAEVMEFVRRGDSFVNGLGESVTLEEEFVYPLLKSSDLGNGRIEPRKYVIATQRNTNEDTSSIKEVAPRTWSYLLKHGKTLDNRKSSIYHRRSRFSVFGVGDYSFAFWKVAISGLYKSFKFIVVPPHGGRPVLVDDTCYSIPCKSDTEAFFLCDLLSSEPSMSFLKSLVFTDAKRPITADILRRLSFVSIARYLGRIDELEQYLKHQEPDFGINRQMSLVMEPKLNYSKKNGG